jgi:hypothetical protein
VSGRLPEYIVGPDGLTLRRWRRGDAARLGEAIADSVEHLRPWMPWIAHEPLSVTERQARIDSWTTRRLLRQAIATTVAGLLTDAAFSDPAISCEWQITRQHRHALH